jgi:putative FmdB family regulatory protein
MPVYDYKCNSCNTIIELFVWRTQNTLQDQFCQKCNDKLLKVFTSTTSKPILKGSGFYETDYKGKKN